MSMTDALRAAVNVIDEALCLLDGKNRLRFLNAAAERLLGYRLDELSGRDFSEQVGALPEVAAGETEVRFRRKDGTSIRVLCRLRRIAESGDGASCAVVFRPIDRPSGDSLRDSGPTLRVIIDAIAEGVIVIGEGGLIELLNPAAERLFGYAEQEMLGRDIRLLMPTPQHEAPDGYLADFLPTDGQEMTATSRDVRGQRKDGAIFPIHLVIGELREGNRRLFVCITHDLSYRKRTEKKLVTLSEVIDQSPIAILISSLDGRIEYVNLGFTRLTGYHAEDVVGKNTSMLQSGSTTPEQYRRLWDTIRQGKEWRGEIQDRKKNGDLYWALQAISPLRDAAGNITHYLAVQQDVTDQKRNKEALRESEERFRQVADMAGEWLWEQDAAGCYIYSSSAVREILGYEPDEIIGKHYLDLLTPEDRARWTAELAPVQQRRFYRLINHYRHKDGREVFTESTGEPVFDANRELLKWRGVDHDITARKRYEDALRVRDRAIEAASVGISITDAQHEGFPNIYVNPALSRITGYARDELLGQNMGLLQGRGTDPAVVAEIRQALHEGRDCEVMLKNYRKDGTPFWNELLLSPVRDESGKLTHYIGIHTDVTERRRAEEQRHELEIAKQIQLSLLPKKPLRLEEVEVAGVCLPVGHVGGDYFDYFTAGDSVDIVIADVSGHNVGAALIMTEARSTLKAEMRKTRNGRAPHSAARILGILNELLYEDLAGTDLFITMFYLKYELRTRRLSYANAGHNCALLARLDDTGCESLDAEGLILGVNRKVAFEEKSVMLRKGDAVLLYTDGVTEARNEQGEFFGIPRLCRALTAHQQHAPRALIEKLLDELRAFCRNRRLEDDISMVVLKVL